MVRTPCCDKTGLKKGTWTPEEDRKLKGYIGEHGCSNWRQLPKLAGLSRCGKSCRLRWMNYLRPNIKRGNFSQEEEDIIVKLHESLGNRWSAIAAELPGRTDNEVKNHWHTYLKKQSRQISISQGENSSPKSRSKCKNTRGKRSEFKNSSKNNPIHQIVESSQFSPKPSSSDQLCLSVMDTLAGKTQSFIAENGVSASEIFAETAGSFWTEPFLADNHDATYDVLAPLVNNGFLYPNYPLTGEELLGSYGFYDEYNNVLIW